MPSVENAHNRVVKCAKDMVFIQFHLWPVHMGADIYGERYLDCIWFTGKIMIDLQREFLDVFVARIAKQKDHHDTELSVTPHLIWN